MFNKKINSIFSDDITSYATYYEKINRYNSVYESGDIVLPEGCEEIKWVKNDETPKLIPYEEMNKIIWKINECDYLFGGSFRIAKNPKTKKRNSIVIESFYRLN